MTFFIKVKNEINDTVKEMIIETKKYNNEIYKTKSSLYNKPKREKCPNNKIFVYVAVY
jgi:hypothetical protein